MKKKILQALLGFETKRIVRKYRPKVIAITGSVGKTSTKNAIAFLLEKFINVRGGSGNLNTEFGVPLVFIGKNEGGGSSLSEWGKIVLSGFGLMIKKERNYPKIIIAEMGADKPGDISYLTGLVKPDIGVITMIGETPVHLENYESVDDIIKEKSKILKRLDENGFAILNFDDPAVRKMNEKIKARTIYFGFDPKADVVISDFSIETKGAGDKKIPYGISFNISYGREIERIHLPYCLGKPFAYAVAASFACGMATGIDLRRAPDIFRDLKPEEGRMSPLEGDDYLVLNDTYNASPASMASALETLNDLPATRKIAVLGDMKELGDRSIGAHKNIGNIASRNCHILMTVGDQAEMIKEAAVDCGMSLENATSFKSNDEVIRSLKSILKSGDLILIKGSRSMKMEEIVKAIT